MIVSPLLALTVVDAVVMFKDGERMIWPEFETEIGMPGSIRSLPIFRRRPPSPPFLLTDPCVTPRINPRFLERFH